MSDWKFIEPTSSGGDDFQPEGGDDFIEEGNSENFLQSIIKSARGPMGLASSPMGMLPSSGQEAMDIGKVGLGNTLGMINPFGSSISPMSMGANMADQRGSIIGVPQIEEAMKPQTEYGQGLDLSAKAAMLASPFALNPGLGGQMLGSAKKGIGGITDLFNLGKANRGLSGEVRKGALSAEGALGKMGQAASEEMGASLQTIEDTGRDASHIRGLLDKVATFLDEGGSTFGNPNSAAGQVLQLKEGLPVTGNFTGPQLQAKYVEIKDALGKIGPAGKKAQHAFSEAFKDLIPDELKSAREAFSSYHAKAKAAEPLTRHGTLNKIGKKTMDDELLAELEKASKQVPGLENLISKITGAGQKVRNVKTARTVGKWGAGVGAGIPLLRSLMRGLGGASNITNVYQGGE